MSGYIPMGNRSRGAFPKGAALVPRSPLKDITPNVRQTKGKGSVKTPLKGKRGSLGGGPTEKRDETPAAQPSHLETLIASLSQLMSWGQPKSAPHISDSPPPPPPMAGGAPHQSAEAAPALCPRSSPPKLSAPSPPAKPSSLRRASDAPPPRAAEAKEVPAQPADLAKNKSSFQVYVAAPSLPAAEAEEKRQHAKHVDPGVLARFDSSFQAYVDAGYMEYKQFTHF